MSLNATGFLMRAATYITLHAHVHAIQKASQNHPVSNLIIM